MQRYMAAGRRGVKVWACSRESMPEERRDGERIRHERKEERERGRENTWAGNLVCGFMGFYLFSKGGNFRGGLREGLQQNIHQFSRCALSGSWSPPTGQLQGRGSLVIEVVLASPPGFAAFQGLELKHN